MVTLTSADNALKQVYLGVVSNQLNTNINPLMARIKQTTSDVWGKEIRKLAPYGLNGGIGAGTETGNLPSASGNNYAQFVLTLKNLYGKIEISDKAVRASENNAGAFVNLLNAEMEGLVRASAFNFGRMLFGGSKGLLTQIDDNTASTSGGDIALTVSSVKNLMEGMLVDIVTSAGVAYSSSARGLLIKNINRTTKVVTLSSLTGVSANAFDADAVGATIYYLVLQGSYGNEITGLDDIFDTTNVTSLYGLARANYNFMSPYTSELPAISESNTKGQVTDIVMQSAVDRLDEVADSKVDFIVCSAGVKHSYQSYLASYRSNVDVMNLEGGYKAISFNGIPVISDRFAPAEKMYLLNTKEFNLHQLCDWKWLEGDNGKVIRQNEGKPTYSATLVKYADVICNKIAGQAVLTNCYEL